jgi:hypothetical protein
MNGLPAASEYSMLIHLSDGLGDLLDQTAAPGYADGQERRDFATFFLTEYFLIFF